MASSTVTRAVFARDGRCCRYCGYKHRDIEKFQVEHVIPLSKGGPDTLANTVVACRRCNWLKSTQTWVPMSRAEARRLVRPLTRAEVVARQFEATLVRAQRG